MEHQLLTLLQVSIDQVAMLRQDLLVDTNELLTRLQAAHHQLAEALQGQTPQPEQPPTV